MDDVLNQIEEKVKNAISTIHGLKSRIRELEADNAQLRSEMQDNQSKLTHMLDELSRVDAEDAAWQAKVQEEASVSEPPAWEGEEGHAKGALVSEIILESSGFDSATPMGHD